MKSFFTGTIKSFSIYPPAIEFHSVPLILGTNSKLAGWGVDFKPRQVFTYVAVVIKLLYNNSISLRKPGI